MDRKVMKKCSPENDYICKKVLKSDDEVYIKILSVAHGMTGMMTKKKYISLRNL
jgi:hypothetical protein